MQRRGFLKTLLAGGMAANRLAADPRVPAVKAPIPQRSYRGGVKLSLIGLGGIVVCGMEQKDADNIVSESVDRGVNYFDVAPTYFDGEAEIKLGNALRPYRNKVFLACKTTQRDAAGAEKELEQSLRRLHTDHFDLYQFHAVRSLEDVERILAPGGAGKVFAKARRQGKARFLGLSAHSAEAAIALLDRFPVDSILFPVNFVLYSQGNFGPQILAHAKKKGVSRLALKALAHTTWPKGAKRQYAKCWYRPIDDPELAARALRFSLSEDVTAAIPPGEEKFYRWALDFAAAFQPLTAAQREQLLTGAQGLEPIFRA